MRILYHHRTLGDGAEGIHIREMIRAFRALGHEVRVTGPAGEEITPTSRRSRALSSLKRAVPAAAYELLEIAYGAVALLRTMWLIRRFSPDFVYDRYIGFNVGTILAARLSRVPLLLEVNAPLALERRTQADEKLVLHRIATAMERWACANAYRTIVVSTPLKDYLESAGVPRGKCVVMPNGVDPAAFAPRAKDGSLLERIGSPPGAFIVGFTGVLRQWHGLDLLLEAAQRLSARRTTAFFLIVGDGPYREAMERRIAEMDLRSVFHITGRVPHAQVPAYISLFDVAVSPKATFYASPMKVVEYMALAKPVLVPRTPNFLDIVDEGENAVTFADGDAAALADAVADLSASPPLCDRLGAAARRKVEVRLNWRWNALRSCELAQAGSGGARGPIAGGGDEGR